MEDSGEETATASHLFDRLSSKEDDPFGEISANANEPTDTTANLENIQEMDDKELIAQMDAIEISTTETLAQSSTISMSEEFKEKVKSIWPAPKKFLRIFKNRKDGKPLISSDYSNISQPR